MELKVALLAIHITLLLFLISRPVIRSPRSIFGTTDVDRDDQIRTIVEYDEFGSNSKNLTRFYLSSTVIRMVFVGFFITMIVFVISFLADVFEVNSPSSVTSWPNGQSEYVLTISNKKANQVHASGPITSQFYIGRDGQVFPINSEEGKMLFIMVDKNGPLVINARSAADLFGVVALFLAIACMVLWLVHCEEI